MVVFWLTENLHLLSTQISAWRFLPIPVGFLVDSVPLIGQGNPPNPYRAAMGDAQENLDPFQNLENLVQNPLEIQTVTQALVYLRGCTPVTDAYRGLAEQVGAFAVSHLPIHKILPLLAHYVNQMSNVPDGEEKETQVDEIVQGIHNTAEHSSRASASKGTP
ncbi:hypothetical protein RHSIM_RhsimUnG0086100 [Rhododendron simsii]|uniref:Uncharacterized protein n=1 Tax=Rhododendron simsii TaxID=118357 RepID=A0A834FXW1_RHOSS|nr:hypothetical protein RHSIM_RhsimUnG0086100 [Rhododendron simsii]